MDLGDEGDCQPIRKVRDPIHRYITLTRIECKVISSAWFQRLANISQMHSADLVYPGAKYSRKIHSLGAMHLANKVFCRLLYRHLPQHRKISLLVPGNPLPDKWANDEIPIKLPLAKGLAAFQEDKGYQTTIDDDLVPLYMTQIMRLAAMLHDIGHGPYSHLLESCARDGGYEFNHEKQGVGIIRDVLTKPFPGAHSDMLLEPEDASLVAAIIDGKDLPKELGFMHDIISGALDVDKMDYVMRDSHFAGTPEYGTIDLERLIEALVVHEDENGATSLAYTSDCLDAVVSAMNAMFFMYNNVYLHKTVQAFDKGAIDGAKNIGWWLESLMGDYDTYLKLDETSLLQVLQEQRSEVPGTKARRFDSAIDALRALRLRRKEYHVVFNGRMTYPLEYISGDYANAILDIQQVMKAPLQVFQGSTGFEPSNMLGKNIRPVGLKQEDLIYFMNSARILNVDTGEMERFRDHSPYYKTLNRIVVPVRYFLDRTAFDKVSDQPQWPEILQTFRREGWKALREHHEEVWTSVAKGWDDFATEL